MAFRVDEDARVAAPESLGPGAADRSARGLRLGERRVDLLRRSDVVGDRYPAPAAGVADRTVLGELRPIPQRDDAAGRPEEDDVVVRLRACGPPHPLVER